MEFAFTTVMIYVALFGFIARPMSAANFFDTNFDIIYGNDHVKVVDDQGLVELSVDQFSGTGFKSRVSYGSGYFNIRVKIPHNKDSHAILSTFYLSSAPIVAIPLQADHHDELDFEFYGSDRLPIILQTNVYVHGHGNREQKVALWFDPRADFHSYTILWNQWHVVFLVDDVPIRVFNNLTRIGQDYITEPMSVWASIWNASWAEHGRLIDWSQAPFTSSYKNFNIQGCPITTPKSSHYCNSRSHSNWWNGYQFRHLDSSQQAKYKVVREKYVVYDYCSDKSRYPTAPVECGYN